jgi:hypothetical protein
VLFTAWPWLAEADGRWRQYKKEDGIIGYERNVEGSKYLETRAETVVDSPIEVLVGVLKDVPSYPLWMYRCIEATPLVQDGEWRRVLYFAQSVPFGSPDRDVVIEAITIAELDKGSYIAMLRSIDNHPYQASSGQNENTRQRMVELHGTWNLKTVDRNRTEVIYTIYTDPGGFAPGFLGNYVIRRVSFQSLKGLISLAKELESHRGSWTKGIKINIDNAVMWSFHSRSTPNQENDSRRKDAPLPKMQ